MEWDTAAAAYAVVLESSMNMQRYEVGLVSRQLTYNKQNLLNPFFVVSTCNGISVIILVLPRARYEL